jgi:hypothetical protein
MWANFMLLPETVVCSMPLTPMPICTRAVSWPVVLPVMEAPVPVSVVCVPANQARLPSVMPMSKWVLGPLHSVLWLSDVPPKLNVVGGWEAGWYSGSAADPGCLGGQRDPLRDHQRGGERHERALLPVKPVPVVGMAITGWVPK